MKPIRFFLFVVASLLAVSCGDTNLYNEEALKPGQEPKKEANTFDFSTEQTVNLTVDYSAFKTYGPVFFSIYHENPFVGEGDDQHLDENALAIYENYTDNNGVFSNSVTLPAYAKHIYIVTGCFTVNARLIEADIQNGVAKAVAVNNTFAATRAAATRLGQQTDDLSTMPHLSYLVDEDGNVTDDREYKDWLTLLGTWDSQSGAPSYIIQPGQVSDELLCSAEEIEGLYSAVNQALNANRPCQEEYRNLPDMSLEKDSEVTLTFLGGSTCWNSSLGYYYYKEGEEPTSTTDLNIIMLVPNTQDGNWKNIKPNMSYNNNIGINRGDAILLKYYPNIANNGDTTGETTVFPKGIRIGFILKTHAWGMQGPSYCIKGHTDSKRKYNVWGATTNGMSFCSPFGNPGEAPYQFTNPTGESRCAKFAYTSSTGDKYAIVSFEDACNDQDYDDVIFALKPVNSFKPVPDITDKTTTTIGVYAFEDLWPSKGDYDMNDVMVDFKHVKYMKKEGNNPFKLYEEAFYLKTYQNYVELKSGLALKLDTPVAPASIIMKKIANGSTEEEEVSYTVKGNIYFLTEDIKAELGTTYILELKYSKGQTNGDLASVEPFIYRNEPANLTWEVHLPYHFPTSSVNISYFGSEDDASSIVNKKFYIRKEGNYPFAFFLSSVKIESFFNTILKRENESKKISDIYKNFLDWSISKGEKNTDWYLYPSI